MTSKFTFKPVYGYGWRLGSGPIEVPATFVVEGEKVGSSVITGKVLKSHAYENRHISLSLRSSLDGANHFNVVIHPESDEEEVTGFAELVL